LHLADDVVCSYLMLVNPSDAKRAGRARASNGSVKKNVQAQAHVYVHIQAQIDKTGFAVLNECLHRDVKAQAHTAPIQMLVLATPFGGLVSGPKALRFGKSWPFFRLIKFFSDTTSPD
jgi:hypothetical protein